MSDTLGVYNSPNNTGLATKLQSTSGYFDAYRSGLDEAYRRNKLNEQEKYAKEQAVAKEATRKQERLEDIAIEQLKAPETWSKISQSVTDIFSEGLAKATKGEIGLGGIMEYANKGNQLANAGNEIKANFDKGLVEVRKNPLINESEWMSAYNDKYISPLSKGDTSFLYDQEISNMWFLGEDGGSAAINEYEAVKKFATEDLLGWAHTKKSEPVGSWKNAGYGLLSLTTEEIDKKFHNYVTYDDETGEVSVKDPEALIEAGLLSAAMSDPYMARLIKDKGDAMAKALKSAPSPAIYAKVLEGMLKPTAKATVLTDEKVQTARTATTPASSGKTTQKEVDRISKNYWVRAVKGEGSVEEVENARAFITNAALTNGTITSMKVDPATGVMTMGYNTNSNSSSRVGTGGDKTDPEIPEEISNSIIVDKVNRTLTIDPTKLSRYQLLTLYERSRKLTGGHWVDPDSAGFINFMNGGGQGGTPTVIMPPDKTTGANPNRPVVKDKNVPASDSTILSEMGFGGLMQ